MLLDHGTREEPVLHDAEVPTNEGTEQETAPMPETNPSANSWFSEIGRWRGDAFK